MWVLSKNNFIIFHFFLKILYKKVYNICVLNYERGKYMIYLEIITSIIIFIIMACMSAIGTAYLAISEKDFNFDEIKDKKKVRNIKLILKSSS